MTPERIEEIKRMMEEEYARPDAPYSGRFIANAPYAIADLLAALEESQQQRDNYSNKEEEARWEAAEYREELVEAQQTIARQREALEFYANKENWELPSFGRGHSEVTSDRGSRARAALEGNKEGSDNE
jgi:hypothetical protein